MPDLIRVLIYWGETAYDRLPKDGYTILITRLIQNLAALPELEIHILNADALSPAANVHVHAAITPELMQGLAVIHCIGGPSVVKQFQSRYHIPGTVKLLYHNFAAHYFTHAEFYASFSKLTRHYFWKSQRRFWTTFQGLFRLWLNQWRSLDYLNQCAGILFSCAYLTDRLERRFMPRKTRTAMIMPSIPLPDQAPHAEPHSGPLRLLVFANTILKGMDQIPALSRALAQAGIAHQITLSLSTDYELFHPLFSNHPHIEYLSELPDLAAAFNAHDLVLYTHSHGVLGTAIPYMIVEAMAHGKAVIATDTGSHSEFILNGQNGRLVRPGMLTDYVAAIQTLLTHDKRQILGYNALKTVSSRFSPEQEREGILAFYRQILK